MSAVDEDPPVFVPTVEAVQWAIETLTASRVHPFFLAYVHLRRWDIEQETEGGIRADWEQLGEFLEVPGGPPGKPFYRPFLNGQVKDNSRYWLNPNIAGSYAPSSLRNVPLKVVETGDGLFYLKEDHAELALENLLFGEPLSAVAFAFFYYRNFGVVTPAASPAPLDLVAVFARDFQFSPLDDDFDVLFETDFPDDMGSWFEELDDMTAGVE